MTNLTRPDATACADKSDAMLNGKLLIRLDLGPVSHEIDLSELEAKLPALLHGIGELRKQLWPEAKCQMEFDESLGNPWSRHLVLQHFGKCFSENRADPSNQ